MFSKPNMIKLSVLALSASPAIAAELLPFNIISITSSVNDRTVRGYEEIHLQFEDPSTKTHTDCGFAFNSTIPNQVNSVPPSDWTSACNDPTFSVRFIMYRSETDFMLGLRHQYQHEGESCTKSNDPECVTRLAYTFYNPSVPNFGVSYYDHQPGDDEPETYGSGWRAPVYQQCYGCAVNEVNGA